MGRFWGAPAMALMTVGAGTLTLGQDWIGPTAALRVDAVLRSGGPLLGLITAVWAWWAPPSARPWRCAAEAGAHVAASSATPAQRPAGGRYPLRLRVGPARRLLGRPAGRAASGTSGAGQRAADGGGSRRFARSGGIGVSGRKNGADGPSAAVAGASVSRNRSRRRP